MKNKNISIRKVVGYLNNEEYEGGFWLPNIQRPFVWGEDQVERLFDSIMREYPISTLLVWRTKSGIKRRKFIDNYFDDLKLSRFQVPEDHKIKLLVLDGQQRLQSLFIGLKGSYEKRELMFNVLSGAQTNPEEMRYQFRFMPAQKAVFPWVNFKQLVFSNEMPNDLAAQIIEAAPETLIDDEKRRIVQNVWQSQKVFVSNEAVSYQELDSVDNPKTYTEDDVVEIFIRANSGGTKLGKSDLLFSLLTAAWDDADAAMEDLISELNASGYDFGRDFILKTCLVLLDKGAAYDVKKFRDEKNRHAIIDQWSAISDAIKDVRDFLHSKTYIRSDHALPSYIALIPVIYFRYKHPERWSHAEGLDTYFLRTLLCGAFSGRPDGLVDKCIRRINQDQGFIVANMFDVIYNDGRNLDISEETILQSGYGSKNIHLIFNLWYRQFDYIPAYDGNLPQVDHIFPQSLLRSVKETNSESGRKGTMRYPAPMRDRIANCMLLTAEENGFQQKCDTPPEEWFSDKSKEYFDLHLIPNNPELWKLENYERFIEAREKLIVDKLHYLLTDKKTLTSTVTPNAARVREHETDNPSFPPIEKEVQQSMNMDSYSNENIDQGSDMAASKSSPKITVADIDEAEHLLEKYLERIANPTKYIAGFRTADGKELAIERESKVITIWSEQVKEMENAGFSEPRLYEESTPRNSNLNRKNCPKLRLGSPVAYWKFADAEDLLDFINWYSEAKPRMPHQ